MQERWAAIDRLAVTRDLPPVELYKVGDAYFVADGHHRVSVARRAGWRTIMAHVREYHTRVPLESETALGDLLIKKEYLEFLELGEALNEMAAGLKERELADTNTNQFVTAFYGVLDPITGTLTYSNAGHNPPYLLSTQNGTLVQELDNTGPPLGLRMFKDMAWEQNTVQLGPGDVLVLYTDGVTEAQDAQEELFEEERLLEVVQANVGHPAQAIQDALIGEVHAFVGDAPQADDITLMVLVRDVLERRVRTS